MKTQFFSEAPRPDWQCRDEQKGIAVDYRLCFEAMNAGREDNRGYLATKYSRPLTTIRQLNCLATELFARLGDEERASDLYDVERKLAEIA
jgi:hypothetical protein